jgi:hypothetical protein
VRKHPGRGLPGASQEEAASRERPNLASTVVPTAGSTWVKHAAASTGPRRRLIVGAHDCPPASCFRPEHGCRDVPLQPLAARPVRAGIRPRVSVIRQPEATLRAIAVATSRMVCRACLGRCRA